MTHTNNVSSIDTEQLAPTEAILLLLHSLSPQTECGCHFLQITIKKKKCQEEEGSYKRIDYSFREQQIASSGFMDF